MPPCVRMRPSSTVILPGPTCFHPVRSLPLNKGFHGGACGCAAAIAKRVEIAATISDMTHLRGFIARCSSGRSSQARAQRCCAPTKKSSKLELVQVVVTDFNVVEG